MNRNENMKDVGSLVVSQAMELFALGIEIEAARTVLNQVFVENGYDFNHPAVLAKCKDFDALCDQFALLEANQTASMEEYKNRKAKGEEVASGAPMLHIVEGGGESVNA